MTLLKFWQFDNGFNNTFVRGLILRLSTLALLPENLFSLLSFRYLFQSSRL